MTPQTNDAETPQSREPELPNLVIPACGAAMISPQEIKVENFACKADAKVEN